MSSIDTTKVQQYSLILYSKKDLNKLLKYNVKRYAYIYHDKDTINAVREQKTLQKKYMLSKIKLIKYRLRKKPHYHLFISFATKRRKKWLETYKAFNKTEQNIFCEPCKDLDGLMLYFLHKTADSKYKHQYKVKEVKANFDIKQTDEITNPHTDIFDDINRIANGEMTYYHFYKTDPSRIFSANSFKTVIEQLSKEYQFFDSVKQAKKTSLIPITNQNEIDEINKIMK